MKPHRIPALLASTALAGLLLAGCASGGGPEPSASPDPSAAEGAGDPAAGEGQAGEGALAPGDPEPSRTGGGPSAAQQVPGSAELVDRTVAVVGDTVLLYSEVQQEIIRRQSQNQLQMPQDPAARDSVFRSVTQELVDQILLLHGAREAGVEVTAGEVDRVVEQRFQEIRNRFGSSQEFRQAVEQSGQNMYQFRQGLESRVRSEMAVQRFLQQNRDSLPPAPVTDEEIRREFEARWAQREGPASLTLRRLVIEPEPDSAAMERARARADTALQELRSGTDFAVVVRRYSQDPGSRDREGDLGWIRRSEVLPSFGDAAWSAPLGRPVGPVETRYGFHVMEVQNVRGGERKIRHVLVRPEFSETDREEARRLATTVADSLRQGADFDRMAERYSDLPTNRETQVEIPVQEVRSRLGPDYAEALEGARSGDVVGPVEISGTRAETAFAVVQVTDYRSSGRYELNEVRDQIREGLAQQKQYRRFLDRLRDDIYVKILI